MSTKIFSMEISTEQDVVIARHRAGHIAKMLGFRDLEQTHFATAVSEIARNALTYGGGGKIEYMIEEKDHPLFLMQVTDHGKGIKDLASILGRRYTPKSEMGMGIASTKRLMDYFHIESAPGKGIKVFLGKIIPKEAPSMSREALKQIAIELVQQASQDPLEVVRQQNRELIRTFEELRQSHEDQARLQKELEDTNRGVLALYAELDDRAEHLKKADKLKSHFLSHMSHEFRSPINSIMALCQILLDQIDGKLTQEQKKQVGFINKAAGALLDLVNDLLDLAKIEAGRVEVHLGQFEVADLFSALRGMMKPLQRQKPVDFIFEDPFDIPSLYTDEAKITQILRNFISNALKFTEKGEVRVMAQMKPAQNAVEFSVVDTGIGIADEDQERIFQEFTQLENPLQKKVKGTGLGLPLTRKLTELLEGTVSVKSQLGVGSTFSALIPLTFGKKGEEVSEGKVRPSQKIGPLLIIENDTDTLSSYEEDLKSSGYQTLSAKTLEKAKKILKQITPIAIVLDILLPGEDCWAYLAELKENEATFNIPIILVTIGDEKEKGVLLGADDFCARPVNPTLLLSKLENLVGRGPKGKILIIDDEEIPRYVLKGLLTDTGFILMEAQSGQEGIDQAMAEHPQVIFLDLMMPVMNGFETLGRLKDIPETQDIPVIVLTSKILTAEESAYLRKAAFGVLSKQTPRKDILSQIKEALSKILIKTKPFSAKVNKGSTGHV